MAKCVNCGGGRLKMLASGDFKRCQDCGCSNIVVRSEHIAAASSFKRLVENGWPHSKEQNDADT